MLRKTEKKALASIFMLIIGWPVGLDQFFEGKNEKGITTTIGWTLTALLFLYGSNFPFCTPLKSLQHQSPKIKSCFSTLLLFSDSS